MKTHLLTTIGQDENIFKQFTLTSKQWCLHNGACIPNPKDDEQGVMLSSYVSRNFGYGYDFTPAQLLQINQFRREKNIKMKTQLLNFLAKKKNRNLPNPHLIAGWNTVRILRVTRTIPE